MELWCPHHQLGCNYRGAALDVVAHLACCPFSPRERSVVSNDSESLDGLHTSEHVNVGCKPLSPAQSSPPMGLQGPHQHQYQGETHNNGDLDEQYAEAFRTPDLSCVPEDMLDGLEISDRSLMTEIVETSINQDAFSELLGDLEMADITLSPIHAPSPHHSETPGLATNGFSTRQQRLVIDQKESEGSGGVVEQQLPPKEANVQPMEVSRQEQHDTNLPNNRQRRGVLVDITTQVPHCVRSEEPTLKAISMDTGSAIMSQEVRLDADKDPQIGDPEQFTPSRQAEQQESQDRQEFTPRRSSQQGPVRRRVLQFHGPWQWQVQRKTEMQSRTSSVITTEVSSPASVTGAPQSPRLSSALLARPVTPYAGLARLFMTQSSAFYAAETSAYLPLSVHEPRYLRPRRKVGLHRFLIGKLNHDCYLWIDLQ